MHKGTKVKHRDARYGTGEAAAEPNYEPKKATVKVIWDRGGHTTPCRLYRLPDGRYWSHVNLENLKPI